MRMSASVKAPTALQLLYQKKPVHVSVAVGGSIIRDIDRDSLRNKLEYLRKKTVDVKSFKIWRGRLKNERKDI